MGREIRTIKKSLIKIYKKLSRSNDRLLRLKEKVLQETKINKALTDKYKTILKKCEQAGIGQEEGEQDEER